MSSIQGIICKQLKNQGNLPEKWNDLAMDPAIDPLVLEFFQLTQKIKLTGYSSGNEKMIIPAGKYPYMTDMEWSKTEPFKIITPPKFTGEYYTLTSSSATYSAPSPTLGSRMAIFLAPIDRTGNQTNIDRTNVTKNTKPEIQSNRFGYCYLGTYVRTAEYRYGFFNPYFDLNQEYLVNDEHKIAAV